MDKNHVELSPALLELRRFAIEGDYQISHEAYLEVSPWDKAGLVGAELAIRESMKEEIVPDGFEDRLSYIHRFEGNPLLLRCITDFAGVRLDVFTLESTPKMKFGNPPRR